MSREAFEASQIELLPSGDSTEERSGVAMAEAIDSLPDPGGVFPAVLIGHGQAWMPMDRRVERRCGGYRAGAEFDARTLTCVVCTVKIYMLKFAGLAAIAAQVTAVGTRLAVGSAGREDGRTDVIIDLGGAVVPIGA